MDVPDDQSSAWTLDYVPKAQICRLKCKLLSWKLSISN